MARNACAIGEGGLIRGGFCCLHVCICLHLTFLVINSLDASGPRNVRVYVDQPHLDFSEAENTKGTNDYNLTKAQLAGEKFATRYVKYQNVHSITVSRHPLALASIRTIALLSFTFALHVLSRLLLFH